MKKKKWKLTQRVASNIIVVFAGVAFFFFFSNFDAVRAQLAAWVRIIAPFIWGLALAYLLAGPVGPAGIWLAIPIGWFLADVFGYGVYFRLRRGRGKAG